MQALKRMEAGLFVPYLCREIGIIAATIYNWCAKFGGTETSLVGRSNELEEENQWLKKTPNKNSRPKLLPSTSQKK